MEDDENNANGSEVESARMQQRQRQDAMQKKAFTRWWNVYVKQRGIEITDLTAELADGLALIHLVETISGEFVGHYNKVPRHKAQKLENLNCGLKFIGTKGIKLLGIGAEDLHDGKETLILGLSWMLILRFEIQQYSADVHELLQWCKDRTAGYPNISIRNFKESFNDGLAFCGLIHKHFPQYLDYSQRAPGDDLNNVNIAFDTAYDRFQVPKLLDASDLLSGQPDEKSVITYVAKLRAAFSDQDARLKDEARKREMAITDAMRDRFDAGIDSLMKWVNDKDTTFTQAVASGDLGNSIDETKAKLAAYRDGFVKQEKPPKAAEKAELQKVFGEMEQRRIKEGRPPFDHPHSLPNLEKAWGGMDHSASDYEAALLARLKQLEDDKRRQDEKDQAAKQLNTLLPAFLDRRAHEAETDRIQADADKRAEELGKWTRDKDAELQRDLHDLPSTADEAAAKLDKLINQHLGQDKPPKLAEKVAIDALRKEVAQRRVLEGRGPADDAAGKSLDVAWKGLAATEDALAKALLDRLRKLRSSQSSLERFRRIAARLRNWYAHSRDSIHSTSLPDELGALFPLIDQVALLNSDLAVHLRVQQDLARMGAALRHEPEFVAEIDSTLAEIDASYAPLTPIVKSRGEQLHAHLTLLQLRARNHLAHSQDTNKFASVVEEALEYIEHPLESDTSAVLGALVSSNTALATRLASPSDGADATRSSELLSKWHTISGQLATRSAEIQSTAEEKRRAATALQQLIAATRHFDEWYQRLVPGLSPSALSAAIPQADQLITQARAALHELEASGASAREEAAVGATTVEAMQKRADAVRQEAVALARLAEKPLPATDAPAVRKALAALAETKGKITQAELEAHVPQEQVAYLVTVLPPLPSGDGFAYDSFNPHTSAPAHYATAVPASPASHVSSRPASSVAAPSPSKAAAAPAAPTPDSLNVEGERSDHQLQPGVTMYTTQGSSRPMRIKYEVGCDSSVELTRFTLALTGSTNIRVLHPEQAGLDINVGQVNRNETVLVGVIEQVDPYSATAIRTGLSWLVSK